MKTVKQTIETIGLWRGAQFLHAFSPAEFRDEFGCDPEEYNRKNSSTGSDYRAVVQEYTQTLRIAGEE